MAKDLSHGKTGDICLLIAHCTFAFLGVVVTGLLLKLGAVFLDDTPTLEYRSGKGT